MKKTRIYLFIIFSSISFFQMDCKDDSPIPPDNKPVLGKRNFVWTIDTIAYPESYQTMMRDIWVDKSSNVFIVGQNERGYGQMYHYDGVKWDDVKLSNFLNFAFDLNSIQGFASNNIWAVGEELQTSISNPIKILDSSLIIHFDGVVWSKYQLPSRGRYLIDISGSSPSNIWAGGYQGSLYHFDGNSWSSVRFPDSLNIGSILVNSLDSVFIYAYTLNGSYFLKKVDTLWRIIDSNIGGSTIKFGGNLGHLGDAIYSIGPNLYRFEDAQWTMIKAFQGQSLTSFSGKNETDYFVVGDKNLVYHYNGIDWYQYPSFLNDNVVFVSVWSDGKEVFIVGLNYGQITKTIIIHGK
ncbi:MAG: hypothetical protein WCW35_04020 [Bacteroidota bacterium]